MAALWIAVLLVAVISAASGQSDNTQSGCEVCASTGSCSRAYRGGQGQFCGNWLDRQDDRRPCCCPVDAVYKVSNYACNCGIGAVAQNNGEDGVVWLWWLLAILGLLCCCGSCIMVFKECKEQDQDTDAPGEPICAITPSYGTYYRRSGGMGASIGAALGGTAGFGGGLLLGQTIAGHGGHGGDAGGFDGGGGDFAGDF